MKPPRLAMLVHGGPESIECVRARGLAGDWPKERLLCLTREGSRFGVARRWWSELRRWKPDVVYVLNTAMPGALVAPLWSALSARPYVLDTGDVIHEMAVRSGVTPAWKRPALRIFEAFAQRRAATIVVRGTRHQEHLRRSGHPRVELVRDGFLPAPAIPPDDLQALKRRLGLEGSWVLGVMGSLVWSPTLQICYGWDLVEAMAQLRDLPLRGLIIGDGDGRAWLERKARALGVLDRIVFTGRIPYPQVPLHLGLMDFAMSTQTNNLPGQVRTTGKLPEYMATARFILASRVGEAALLLPELMLVDYEGEVDPAYPSRLAARVRQLMGDPELMEERHRLPALAEEHCSYPRLAARFSAILHEVHTRHYKGASAG